MGILILQRIYSEIKNKNQKISIHLILNFVLVKVCLDILFHSNSISLETRTTQVLSAPGKLSQDTTLQNIHTQYTGGRLFGIPNFTCSIRLQTLYDVPRTTLKLDNIILMCYLEADLKKKKLYKNNTT